MKVWESVQVSCIRNAAGEITNLLCLREDITERKRLEEELRQAQKMESLGTLAGGIAHDFNNLLAVIKGFAELSALHPDEHALLQKSLREIKRAAQRASGLVRQILTFSRKAEVNFAPVDINQLVSDLVSLLAETFPRKVAFSVDLADGLPALFADQNQLQQVVLNLCVNARDAMPDGRNHFHHDEPGRGRLDREEGGGPGQELCLHDRQRHRRRHAARTSRRGYSSLSSPPRPATRARASASPWYTASSPGTAALSTSKAGRGWAARLRS